MKKIYANNFTTLSLGRQGENLARQVVFDLSAWEAEYGPGTAELIHQRPGDAQPYPLAVQRDGTLVTWDVTATDTEMSAATANERYGKCELRYYAGETLAKSQIWRTWVESAMDTPSETAPPEPEQGWVEQVLATGVAAQQSANSAKADADRAAVLAAEVAQNASQVAQNVSYTNEAKEAAVLSASEAAQSAQEAAGSASVASTSETNAKASEVSAKAAQKAATESANAAANSAELASEDASAAQQSATSAAESAAVYDTVVADVTKLKQDVSAITPDDTTVDGKPWTSKKTVDALCARFEETGNPVQVYPVEAYPLGVRVSWEPTQGGSGDPSPDNIRPITGRDAVSVTRCGENLLDMSKCVAAKPYQAFGLTVTIDGDTIHIRGVPNVSIDLPNATFRVFRINQNALLANKNNLKVTILDANDEIKYASIGSDRYFVIQTPLYVGQEKDCTFRVMMSYDTPTAYEPYTGSTTDIALPETVYGGTLDVETGVLTVDRGITIADGTTNKFRPGMTWGLPSRTSPGIVETYWGMSIISSHFKGSLFASNKTYEFIFTSLEKMTGLFDTVDELNAYLAEQNAAGTPVTFVYKLANPYTIQISPQQIAALGGVNTLCTDADGVVVTGAEDPKHTITELKNAIISLGGNV